MTEISRLGVGDRLSEYQLIDRLGEGPFSEVWEAHHEEDGEDYPYALKVAVHPLYVQWMADHETFAFDVDHHNLLMANEIDFAHVPPYLVYDLIPGESLQERFDQGYVFGEREAAEILMEVAEAVGALHKVGEFHGALKPKNVQLADDGAALVLDTETARITRDIALITRRTRRGQPPLPQIETLLPYIAPEDLDQAGRTDPRGDVYSLGALAYQMLTRQKPVANEPPTADDMAGVEPAWVEVVMRSVAPVDERYQNAGELVSALKAMLTSLPADEDGDDVYEIDEEVEGLD